jgi:cation:H+ antiporter
LSAHYGLPAIVQGAIVAAVGSSFPELSATVLATVLHGEFDLGVGAIVGSAVFNVLVIPAASALAARDGIESSRELVYKESLFYLLSIAVLFVVFASATVYNPVDRVTGVVTRGLALLPLAVYGLYVFVQYTETVDHEAETVSRVRVGLEWAVLMGSLVVIVAGVEGLVRAAIGLGDLWGTPSFVWGLTVVAAATSLPDLFVSVKAAKREAGKVSLANVLGSNIFDLLVAIPAGVLVAGATVVNFGAAVPMMGALTLATVLLFAFLRTELEISRLEAYALLFAYAGFVGFVLERGGLLNVT